MNTLKRILTLSEEITNLHKISMGAGVGGEERTKSFIENVHISIPTTLADLVKVHNVHTKNNTVFFLSDKGKFDMIGKILIFFTSVTLHGTLNGMKYLDEYSPIPTLECNVTPKFSQHTLSRIQEICNNYLGKEGFSDDIYSMLLYNIFLYCTYFNIDVVQLADMMEQSVNIIKNKVIQSETLFKKTDPIH